MYSVQAWLAARAPDSQAALTVRDHSADPQGIEITDVIGVQMSDEQLVQIVVGNLHRGDALGRSQTDIEDELVAVAQLDDPAGRGLFRPGIGHTGTAGDDPHLVGRQILGARIVDIPVG